MIENNICPDAFLGKAEFLVEQLSKGILSFRGQEGMWPAEVVSNQQDWFSERNTLSGKGQLLECYANRIQAFVRALLVRMQA